MTSVTGGAHRQAENQWNDVVLSGDTCRNYLRACTGVRTYI